ncbi:MAG TPA: 4-hydroxy-tetrahydrodipicolinate reductase [Chthoniobacteraceae bacterium]|nr:4-hydroxy-tetrahydrodipicolinate reductase [Chthoniobacteraceae bacterium]
MSQPLKLLVNGARGRMGEAVIAAANNEPEVVVAATVDAGDDFDAALGGVDAVIDFSNYFLTDTIAAACAREGKRLIIGTTGQQNDQIAAVREAAKAVPIVFAPNFSVGVNTLFWLTRKAAEILGPGFDLEVVEMHHRHKKDAPSGTAKRLAQILAEARNLSYEHNVSHGRRGIVGERKEAEIGMHALRGGDVVGDHTVIYATDGERIELTHKASSRETFARGAIRAALWAAHQAPGPGLYDMQDVLGLR